MPGSYLIRARAKDIHGDTSDWSPPLNISIHNLKWRFYAGFPIHGSAALTPTGNIIVATLQGYIGRGYIFALDRNGSLIWQYIVFQCIHSSPTIGVDGVIYVGSDDYYLYAINNDGTLRWRCITGLYICASPRIDMINGVVYVGSYDGYLYAFSL